MKKIVFLIFIPIFIFLYLSICIGKELLGILGIIMFILTALSQAIIKN